MADKDEAVVKEVTVTRPDGLEYTAQINDGDRKQMEALGYKFSGGKAVEVEPAAPASVKKAPPAKNKARNT